MLKWSIKSVLLPLKFGWKISREDGHHFKHNFIVQVEDENEKGLGEVAVISRYGEFHEEIQGCFHLFKTQKPEFIDGLESLTSVLDGIEIPHSLRFGIESAYIHYLAAVGGISVQKLLSLNQVKYIPTSFSIPIMNITHFRHFYKKHNLKRFKSLKVKIDGSRSTEFIQEVTKFHKGSLRLDANESFRSPNEVLETMAYLKEVDIEFLEQPLPSNMYEASRELKNKIDIPLIADESITNGDITQDVQQQFDGVNIKLMKSGGYIRALNQIKMAKNLNMSILLGCMVETGLGISSAFHIAGKADFFDLDGFLIIKDDPYNFVTEENGMIFSSLLH